MHALNRGGSICACAGVPRQGDNITAMMENMKAKLNLSPEDSAILEQQVVSKAQARRLVPKLTVPVQLESGETDNLLLFEGDSVRQVGGRAQQGLLPHAPSTRLAPVSKTRCGIQSSVQLECVCELQKKISFCSIESHHLLFNFRGV